MSIRSRAPNRIDLGGGTLDIWPLYLLLGRGVTLNVAVSVYSHVALDDEPGGGYRLVSEDTGYENAAKSLGALDFDGPLGLVARAVRYFDPPPGLRVVTRNEAPHGSGLGASSSLLVALLAALERLTRRAPGSTDLVNLAADLEAQVIHVPTGKQDHYAGVYGGANAIWFEPGRNRVESLPMPDSFAHRLRDSMVLSFTGEPRPSAANNWEMVKGYIEGRDDVRAGFEAIRDTAFEMREAWLAQDVERLAALVAREWSSRRSLAPGVSTPGVERAMETAANAGALASKICGAGGGGCMISLLRPESREAVCRALTDLGARVLDFDFDREGLVVRETA